MDQTPLMFGSWHPWNETEALDLIGAVCDHYKVPVFPFVVRPHSYGLPFYTLLGDHVVFFTFNLVHTPDWGTVHNAIAEYVIQASGGSLIGTRSDDIHATIVELHKKRIL